MMPSDTSISSTGLELFGEFPIIYEEEDEDEDREEGDEKFTERNDGECNGDASAGPFFSKRWTGLINAFRRPISDCVLAIARHAATHPYLYIIGIVHFSLSILAFGLFTNFHMEVNSEALYGLVGSRISEHKRWIDKESGFGQYNARMLIMMVHAGGRNVVGEEGLRRCFHVLGQLTGTPGYDELCRNTTFVDKYGRDTCDVRGVTKFWNNRLGDYFGDVSSDGDVISTISEKFYDDGSAVDLPEILGNYITDNGTVTYAESFILTVPLSTSRDVVNFEGRALDNLLLLQDEWDKEEGNSFRLEVQADRSLDDESTRSILKDMPLIPLVFLFMSAFTCLVFWKFHRVKSRSLLGFGAVASVLLAVMTGYGFLFLFGVPFSMLTQILPFVMFGIGLDDAFIISGAFDRTDPQKEPVERIHEAIEEVGMSIVMTTTTTSFAFGLGCLSNIPAMKWLSFYAFPSVIFDFLYQITFFVAICVLDAKRLDANRYDCCICLKAEEREGGSPRQQEIQKQFGNEERHSGRLMASFAHFIFRPWVKTLVVVVFSAIAVASAISATSLENGFKLSDVVPEDSYTLRFFSSLDQYGHRGNIMPVAYFRGVDQSNKGIQEEMEAFINDLVSMEQVADQPPFFWLRKFQEYVNTTSSVQDLHFHQQLAAFLDIPRYLRTYGDSIVLDEDGNIESSRCVFYMTNLDVDNTNAQVQALKDQRLIAATQPVNQGSKNWDFFTYEANYYLWEFFDAANQELVATVVLGIAAVSVLGFVLIPHWTAILYVFPIITILCIDLLGFLQVCGVTINAVSYMGVMMSIGLSVDFTFHTLLRYYESNEETREEKARDALESIGSSLLLGGLSTFLGIMPLAFSTSKLLRTIFTAFVGMVGLGVSHGLILLPVVLSLVGTTDCIRLEPKEVPGTGKMNINTKPRKCVDERRRQRMEIGGKVYRFDDDLASMPSLSATTIRTEATSDSSVLSLPR